MGFKDFFKKQDEDKVDPLKYLTLSKLKVGYIVDYDMKTWQVKAYNRYNFEDGYIAEEWEINSGDDKWYLERAEDDEVEWSLSKKIPIASIEGDVRKHIMDNDDPPTQIIYKGKKYYLEESGPGYFYEGGEEPAKEFVYWEFIDEDDEHFINIEQWGETEFEAATGFGVEEYQFTNILPGEEGG